MKITGNEPVNGGVIRIERETTDIERLLHGGDTTRTVDINYSGITIRQQFAMAAMQALLSNSSLHTHENFDLRNTIEVAVGMSDALIHELNNTEQ